MKLVFVCTPNNPTGGATEPKAIIDLARRLPDQLVVVDEAYIEFSSTTSLADAVDEVPNLVVLRTLSKAYGLAGARCGTAIARPEVIELLRRVQAPYPIPTPTESAVLDALTPHGVALVEERVTRTRQSRDELSLALGTAGRVRQVYPSEANFLLIEVEDSEALVSELRARGILVRWFGDRLPGHVRVSVGTDEDNALLLEALGIRTELTRAHRTATVTRKTKETNIAVSVDLDDSSSVEVATGIGFYDHMLEQVAKHGGFGLRLTCEGDLHIDDHHTVEDCALALGRALRESLGDKRGIERYGFVLPMDEARAEALVDLSGRPKSVFEASFPDQRVGGLATEMVPHIFESLSQELGAAIHVRVEGKNTHHMVEGAFKAFGRALRQAIRRSGDDVPSTKGVL